jgi:hypothetical protein
VPLTVTPIAPTIQQPHVTIAGITGTLTLGVR